MCKHHIAYGRLPCCGRVPLHPGIPVQAPSIWIHYLMAIRGNRPAVTDITHSYAAHCLNAPWMPSAFLQSSCRGEGYQWMLSSWVWSGHRISILRMRDQRRWITATPWAISQAIWYSGLIHIFDKWLWSAWKVWIILLKLSHRETFHFLYCVVLCCTVLL